MAAKYWLDKFEYHNSIEAARRAANAGDKILRYTYAIGAGGGGGHQYVATTKAKARDLEFDPRFRIVETVKRTGAGVKGARIAFQPKHEVRGELLNFSARLYADRVPGAKGWYVHGHETTGQHYGGNYVRLVAWPNVKGGKRYTFSKLPAGWKTKGEAKRVVAILTRAVRMGRYK